MFGKRKNAATHIGGFAVVSPQVNELLKQSKVKKYEEDVEYKCNTPIFTFYSALIYTIGLVDTYKETLGKNDVKSNHSITIMNSLNNASVKMQRALDRFLSYCQNDDERKRVGRFLHLSYCGMEKRMNEQNDAIEKVIKPFYVSNGEKETSKAYKQMVFVSQLLSTRRLYRIATKSLAIALRTYGNDYPSLRTILPADLLNSAYDNINEVYYKSISKIKDIDFSLDEDCNKTQLRVIEDFTDTKFFAALEIAYDRIYK